MKLLIVIISLLIHCDIISSYNLKPINQQYKQKVKNYIHSSHNNNKLLDFSLNNFNSLQLSQIKNDPWYIWTIISITSTMGIISEKTSFGSMISSPLVTMLLTIFLCNIGILPMKSLVYSQVMKALVPLAIPLLLLDADIKKCINNTGSLFKAFLIGSLGTVVGTIVAYILVPMKGLKDSIQIASALCARHIGGAVNFVAVAEILQISPDVVAAAMAADNLLVAVYFTFLFAISIPNNNIIINNQAKNNSNVINNEINLTTLSTALSIALLLYTSSIYLSKAITFVTISPLVLVSLLSVSLATAFPSFTNSISLSGGVIGVLFMQMFFAVIGAMGHIPTVLSIGPKLFLHILIQIIIHFIVSFYLSKFFKIPYNEMIVASNANVGGPTTAAAMASNKNWKELILPALLTGVFGYAIATFIGILMSKLLPLLLTLNI